MSAVENPAAFPSQAQGSDGLPMESASCGMSLRDYFAGQALVVTLRNDYDNGLSAARGGIHDLKATAHAYRIADAMLAARTQPVVIGGDV